MNIVDISTSALRRLQAVLYLWRATRRKMEPEPALRSELFNAEQMEAYGIQLARRHRLNPAHKPDRLLARLDENEALLIDCHRMFSAFMMLPKVDQRITPAGEWLLDNFYLVEEQIRTARRHLPAGYSRELPQLAVFSPESLPTGYTPPENTGQTPASRSPFGHTEASKKRHAPRYEHLAGEIGVPRVYDIALGHISHGDGRLDSAMLSRFVAAYQTVTPLTLGELWAIPIMLRLALIENLRRVSTRVMSAWHDHNLAEEWADHMIETAGRERKSMIQGVARMAESNPPLSSAFVAEFSRRLQSQNAALALPLTWLEERLGEAGLSMDEMVRTETQQQAADQVSISNSITSLRLLVAVDWREFVEELSVVERALREDPAGVYPLMDFATRDHYRHKVERLARNNGKSENEVALAAVRLARNKSDKVAARLVVDAEGGGSEPTVKSDTREDVTSAATGGALVSPVVRQLHVGYYLRDTGLSQLEKDLASQPISLVRGHKFPRLGRLLRKNPLPLYLGLIMSFTMLFTWPLLHALHFHGWMLPGPKVGPGSCLSPCLP